MKSKPEMSVKPNIKLRRPPNAAEKKMYYKLYAYYKLNTLKKVDYVGVIVPLLRAM